MITSFHTAVIEYKPTAAALDTLSEPNDDIGSILIKASATSFVRDLSPGPSAPRIRAMGLSE